ncbi:MAG: hypothetical protein ACM3MG_08140 [Bacillota bacterium]
MRIAFVTLLALSSVMVSCASLQEIGLADKEPLTEAPQIQDETMNIASNEIDPAPQTITSTESSSSREWVHETEPATFNLEEPKVWQEPKSTALPRKTSVKKAVTKSVKKSAVAKKGKDPKKKLVMSSKKDKQKKALTKKDKVDCKKIVKLAKKAKKTDIAYCKAEKKKLGKKGRSVASK